MKITPILTLCALLGFSVMAYSKDGAKRKDGPRCHSAEEIIKKFDTDGDSKLSADEFEKMRETRKAKMKEMRSARLEKFDTDKNGKLSDEERAAMPKRHKNKGENSQVTPESETEAI